MRSVARRGFSLVELVIVLMIIGVLAGAAAPRMMTALDSQRVESATLRIAADLRAARRSAIRDSTPRTVTFSLTENAYTVEGLSDPDHADRPYLVDLALTGHAARLLSVDFGGDASVTFDVYGRPSAAGVVVVASGGRRRTLELDASGEVPPATP